MEYAHVWGPHTHWFWIIPFLFMILMIFFATRMARRADAWRSGVGPNGRGRFGCWGPGYGPMARWWSETPFQILDRRYASGEITKEQHEQMRSDLETNPSNPGSGEES
jgi:putative membrane protein